MPRQKTIKLEQTRSGLPAYWEAGGGRTHTGHATIVAGRDGEALRPIYIRRRGHLACGEHALFIMRKGYWVVEASHHRRDFYIAVWWVKEINEVVGGYEATLSLIGEYDQGEWIWTPSSQDYLNAAIEAAKGKAICYHCRSPHYIREEEA